MTGTSRQPPQRPKPVADALLARQKARAELEMVVGRVFGLCNYKPEPEPPVRPDTRSVEVYVVRIEAECHSCGGKNARMSSIKYNELSNTLAFGCKHNLPIKSLTIVPDIDEDTPVIDLPGVPQTLTAGSISSTSSILNRTKVERYISRIDAALEKVMMAQATLLDEISQHRIDLSQFPELAEAQVMALGESLGNKAGLAEKVLEDTMQAMEDLSETGSRFEPPSPGGIARLLHSDEVHTGREQLASTDSTRVILSDTITSRAAMPLVGQNTDTVSDTSTSTVMELLTGAGHTVHTAGCPPIDGPSSLAGQTTQTAVTPSLSLESWIIPTSIPNTVTTTSTSSHMTTMSLVNPPASSEVIVPNTTSGLPIVRPSEAPIAVTPATHSVTMTSAITATLVTTATTTSTVGDILGSGPAPGTTLGGAITLTTPMVSRPIPTVHFSLPRSPTNPLVGVDSSITYMSHLSTARDAPTSQQQLLQEMMRRAQLDIRKKGLEDDITRLATRLGELRRDPQFEATQIARTQLVALERELDSTTRDYADFLPCVRDTYLQTSEINLMKSYLHQKKGEIQMIKVALENLEDRVSLA